MFDRNGFMNWLEETFITNSFGRNIVSEIIEYAYEHQNVSLDQFAYFVSDLLPEVEFLEVARFCSDDMLTGLLGLEEFHKIFPVILTDNGSEFKHTRELETTDDGKKRTKVFYCDPQASWQKPQIEKNHEFIRYVLPKGKTLNPYTQEDIIVLMNNINSIRRESLGNKSPYEATADKSILRLMELMGLHLIPADEIRLTSDLLKR